MARPASNEALLESLRDEGWVLLEDAPVLRESPSRLDEGLDFSRVEGMLLGLAIGDALGNTSESMSPSSRRDAYGEIRDYLPTRHAGERQVGVPSDDSQLALWTLEHLVDHGGLVPDRLAELFASRPVFGIGSAVREFMANIHSGQPWYASGARSAGNGALMRIAPVLVPHLREPTSGLWADAALAASMTHRDPASTASCVAFVHLLWEAIRLPAPPPPDWWTETFLRVATPLEGTHTRYRPRGGAYRDFEGPLSRYVGQYVTAELGAGSTTLAACNRFYSGAYLLETVPSALYILARHGADPEEAIVRAVNDTWDNDTIAAIVGAAVGALHGPAALPERWRSGLLGRTQADDDGRAFELIELARARFWE